MFNAYLIRVLICRLHFSQLLNIITDACLHYDHYNPGVSNSIPGGPEPCRVLFLPCFNTHTMQLSNKPEKLDQLDQVCLNFVESKLCMALALKELSLTPLLQPKTELSQQMSPQEKICVDKCHQNNDLTFFLLSFTSTVGENKINVQPLSIGFESTQLSLCQQDSSLKAGDLIKTS